MFQPRPTSTRVACPLPIFLFSLLLCQTFGIPSLPVREANQSIFRRPFEAEDIKIGPFLELDRFLPTRNCPAKAVQYKQIIAGDNGVYHVPHSRIYMDGKKCGDLPGNATEDELWVDKHMELFPIDLIFNESISIRNGTNAAWVRLRTHKLAVSFYNFSRKERLQNPSTSQTWVGFERRSNRVCGNTAIETVEVQQYSFIFFGKNDDILVDVTALVPGIEDGNSIFLQKIHPYHVMFQYLTSSDGADKEEVMCPQMFKDVTFREEEGSIRKCFPTSATIKTDDGMALTMDRLRIGDYIQDGSDKASAVYFFSHRDKDAYSRFITLQTSLNTSLTLSAGHFIHTPKGLARACDLGRGAEILVDGDAVGIVTGVEWEWKRGLFNPHTLSGRMVVDGVVVSVYTDAVDPGLAHGLLAPVRAAYRTVGGWAWVRRGLEGLLERGASIGGQKWRRSRRDVRMRIGFDSRLGW